MRQNLGWAIGDNSLALPIAAGVLRTLGPDAAARDRRLIDVRLEHPRRLWVPVIRIPRFRALAVRGWVG